MSLRHRNKERKKNRVILLFVNAVKGTRIQKLLALEAFGYKINRKADSERVNRIFEKASLEITEKISNDEYRKREKNHRKRNRRRKLFRA